MAKIDRIQWMDAARGLGIILVVFGHVERGLVSSGIATTAWWQVADYTLYTFHMPLFFMLAGFNVPRPLSRGRSEYLKGKLWTIAYPYFLWSLIQGTILVLLTSSTNGKYGAEELLSIPWKPMSQFWFLWVLMACQLVIAIVGVRAAVLAPLAVASFVASQFTQDLLSHALHSLPFFLAGVLLADRASEARPTGPTPIVAVGWAVFAVLVYLSLREVSLDEFESFWALPASIVGIAVVVWAALMLSGEALDVVAYLGTASMTIYVMHVLASAGLRIIMTKLHVPTVDWLYALACTLVGLVVPLVAHVLLGRFNLLWVLGLAPIPKSKRRASEPARA